MILIPHAIVGATIANLLPSQPVIGSSLAFISHYILDMVPHWEYKLEGFIDADKTRVISISQNFKKAFKPLLFIGTDFVLAVSVSYLIFVRDEQSLYLTILGVFFAVLPDFFTIYLLKFKNSFWTKVQRVHEIFHGENRYKHMIIKGILTQVFAVAVFLLVYFWLKE